MLDGSISDVFSSLLQVSVRKRWNIYKEKQATCRYSFFVLVFHYLSQVYLAAEKDKRSVGSIVRSIQYLAMAQLHARTGGGEIYNLQFLIFFLLKSLLVSVITGTIVLDCNCRKVLLIIYMNFPSNSNGSTLLSNRSNKVVSPFNTRKQIRVLVMVNR